ncbi:MAG: hypothetical protein QW041_02585 [Candidatus Pacearchaeota archaeon]
MAEKDKIAESKIKHDGIFDFKDTYRFLFTLATDLEYEVEERVYSEKNSTKGKEIEIEWVAKRKISDYFRFIIKMHWLILGMNDVEVIKEGIKVKTNKGSLEIKFSAYLEKDYENRWEATAFLKFLRGLYDNYIIRGRISDYEDKLVEEMNEMTEQLKAFLVLEAKK